MDSKVGIILTRENGTYRRETCPSATFFTTNSTWDDPGSNPRLRGEKPATNHLSYGTVIANVACSWQSRGYNFNEVYAHWKILVSNICLNLKLKTFSTAVFKYRLQAVGLMKWFLILMPTIQGGMSDHTRIKTAVSSPALCMAVTGFPSAVSSLGSSICPIISARCLMDLSVLLLWVVMPCRLAGTYQRFRGICCLHLQGWTSALRYNPEDQHQQIHHCESLRHIALELVSSINWPKSLNRETERRLLLLLLLLYFFCPS
jgi:hypothetical protein